MTLSRSILILAFALPAAAAAQTAAPYRPGLGDLMTMTVQPRHLKLGLAGQAKNWPYVVYEGHELEEALIQRLEHFLLELGDDFAFMARQKDSGLAMTGIVWTYFFSIADCAAWFS